MVLAFFTTNSIMAIKKLIIPRTIRVQEVGVPFAFSCKYITKPIINKIAPVIMNRTPMIESQSINKLLVQAVDIALLSLLFSYRPVHLSE